MQRYRSHKSQLVSSVLTPRRSHRKQAISTHYRIKDIAMRTRSFDQLVGYVVNGTQYAHSHLSLGVLGPMESVSTRCVASISARVPISSQTLAHGTFLLLLG